jgi:hypothetical protein
MVGASAVCLSWLGLLLSVCLSICLYDRLSVQLLRQYSIIIIIDIVAEFGIQPGDNLNINSVCKLLIA